MNTFKMDCTIGDIFAQEAARAGKPTPSETEVGEILGSQTGWPAFWNIPADGANPQECLRKQVREFFELGWRDPFAGFVAPLDDASEG